MDRRDFIKTSAFSLGYLAFLSTLPGCKKDGIIKTDKRIVIIGAGIAGLAAAKYFKDRGVSVIVLEAQEKVGGRIRTDRSLGIPFDEGASWIHGPNNNPISDIASNAGVTTFLTDDDSVAVFDQNGTAYAESVLDDAESEYNSILNNFNGSQNQSFQDAFYANYPQYQNDRLWTYMLSAYLEFDTGADISELSSLDFYDDEAFRGEDVIITNGYDKVTDYLAQGLDIRLNTPVSGINYSNDTIVITSPQATYEADYVLVTVPLGVLKQNVIAFTPALSGGVVDAVNNLKMGSVNKFLCVWSAPFWDTNLQYIGYTPTTKGKFNYFLNAKKFMNANALMTFAFGDYSVQTESMSDADVQNEIMAHLKAIYGTGIPDPTQFLRTKWKSNPYSYGSYSFATNGSRSTDFQEFEMPVENKLFFAGEHTNKDYRGTVHGAYLSGIREAERIAELL